MRWLTSANGRFDYGSRHGLPSTDRLTDERCTSYLHFSLPTSLFCWGHFFGLDVIERHGEAEGNSLGTVLCWLGESLASQLSSDRPTPTVLLHRSLPSPKSTKRTAFKHPRRFWCVQEEIDILCVYNASQSPRPGNRISRGDMVRTIWTVDRY